MCAVFDPREITSEKSLWEVYKKTLCLSKRGLNESIAAFTFLVIAFLLYKSDASNKELYTTLCRWLEFGSSFAVSMLGFLIAGFAIFATFTENKMFIYMAKIPDPSTENLSFLKSFYLTFFKVFIHYLMFLSVIVFISFTFNYESWFWIKFTRYSNHHEITRGLNFMFLLIVGTYLTYLLLLLKSFIFNIYHIVMTIIRFRIEDAIRREKGFE